MGDRPHSAVGSVYWRKMAPTTAWPFGANWLRGLPPVNNSFQATAIFTATSYNKQPNCGTACIFGLQFGDGTTAAAAVTLAGTSLSLGKGGINILANAAANTISTPIVLVGSQTWNNSTANTLTVSGIVSGTGTITKTGTGLVNLVAANTFAGGMVITAGTLQLSNATAGGTDTITLGDSSGSASATLTNAINTTPIANAISLGATSGTLIITKSSGANQTAVFAGALTLNGSSVIFNSVGTAASPMGFHGGITGTGNVTINVNATGCAFTGSVTSWNNVGTITNSGTSTPTTTISTVIGTNVTGVIQNSATSPLALSGANTFPGGLTVKSGAVLIAVSNVTTVSGAAGPSSVAISLGDTSGAAETDLQMGSFTCSNAINLVAGTSSGLHLVANNGGSTAAIYTGAISLNGIPLTLYAFGTGSLSITGGATGTGDLTLQNDTTTATLTVSTGAFNNVGAITHTGSGSGACTVSSGIGSNVTAVTQSSATSAMTVSGALTLNSGGTSISSSAAALLTFSGGTTGTGNLTVNCNSSGNITISGTSVNHTGTIYNHGVDLGTVTISAAIGTNVTSVTQDTSTSAMVLSATNTTAGALNANAGVLKVTGNSSSATVSISGGTLNGTGTVGNVTASNTFGSVISAGLGVTNGTLNVGSLTLSGSLDAINVYGNGTSTQGLISGTGAFVLGGATVNLMTPMDIGVYNIATTPAGVTGVVVVGTNASGRTVASILAVGTNLVLTLTA